MNWIQEKLFNIAIIKEGKDYMKIVSVFNNKGGVGKTTLGFHLGCALGELGKKVLLVDLDPQCNLTIAAMREEEIYKIWEEEELYIEKLDEENWKKGCLILDQIRSIHFLLMPVQAGRNEWPKLSTPVPLFKNVDLIPGRMSLHKYEDKIAERWNGLYDGEDLSVRTITDVRRICEEYAKNNGYDYVLIDTSPSLGILNKVIISTVDGFIIPALPDMFSLYGIRNIGNSLKAWKEGFDKIYMVLPKEKRGYFPEKFVQFMGYTIYNAKKQSKKLNEYDLAKAHYEYVKKMPETIEKYIVPENRARISNIMEPIGGAAVMHSHNTFPSVAQALKCPMWMVPETYKNIENNHPELLDEILTDKPNPGHFKKYKETQDNYHEFAKAFIERAAAL